MRIATCSSIPRSSSRSRRPRPRLSISLKSSGATVWFNPSLADYLIVAQNRPSIEHFARQENGQWVIATSVIELTESVHIASVNCTLQLAEVYDRVEFPEEEEEPDDE